MRVIGSHAISTTSGSVGSLRSVSVMVVVIALVTRSS